MYNGNHRIQTLHSLIKPISYNSPDEAERIHGISTEYAMKNGIHFAEYADNLRFMIFDADVVVAHNIEFDVLTIFSEIYRNGFLHRQHGSLYAGLDTICGVLLLTFRDTLQEIVTVFHFINYYLFIVSFYAKHEQCLKLTFYRSSRFGKLCFQFISIRSPVF
jgi:hypothetical protein